MAVARDEQLEQLRLLLETGSDIAAAADIAKQTRIANYIIDWLLQARIDEKIYLDHPDQARADLIRSSLANIDQEALTLKQRAPRPRPTSSPTWSWPRPPSTAMPLPSMNREPPSRHRSGAACSTSPRSSTPWPAMPPPVNSSSCTSKPAPRAPC